MNIRKFVESKLLCETVSFRDFEEEDYWGYAGVESDFPKILEARNETTQFDADIIIDGDHKEINVFAGSDGPDMLNTVFGADNVSKGDLLKIGQLIEDGEVTQAWNLIKDTCEEVPADDGINAIDNWVNNRG